MGFFCILESAINFIQFVYGNKIHLMARIREKGVNFYFCTFEYD